MKKNSESETTKADRTTTVNLFKHTVFISIACLNCRFPVIASSAFPACLDALWMLTSEGQQLRQDEGHEERKNH